MTSRLLKKPARRKHIHAAAVTIASAMLVASCSPEQPETETAVAPAVTGIRYLRSDEDDSGFATATAPLNYFSFPRDHGSHPAFRTEWWYFTGNLFDSENRHYGFELTFFRIALTPDAEERESSLATNDVWMAHLAITDTSTRSFQATERLSRGASGIAGVDQASSPASGSTTVRVEDFSAEFTGDGILLSANDAAFGVELELSGLNRIVAQGNNGLDAKGPEPGNASYYFSAPRLVVSGEIRSRGTNAVPVTGSAWMDREWSTSALSSDIEGWDWFALQLDDGRDLMFYRLRGFDGSTGEYSGGSMTSAGGSVTRLDANAVALEVLREWTSDTTGVRYPVEWIMTVPGYDLDLEIQPRLDDQEIDLSVRYWEGAVTVSGTAGDIPVAGVGYLELAGY